MIFNEQKLKEEIESKWGKYGAHAEVYNMLLKELETLRAKIFLQPDVSSNEANCEHDYRKICLICGKAKSAEKSKDGEVACLQISEEVKILLKDKYHEGYNAGYYDGKHDR